MKEWQFVFTKDINPHLFRNDYISSNGVVLEALGSIGNYLYKSNPYDWKSILSNVSTIDWSDATDLLGYRNIKGEFTLVVDGIVPVKEEKGIDWALARVAELQSQGLTPKEAVKQAAFKFAGWITKSVVHPGPVPSYFDQAIRPHDGQIS